MGRTGCAWWYVTRFPITVAMPHTRSKRNYLRATATAPVSMEHKVDKSQCTSTFTKLQKALSYAVTIISEMTRDLLSLVRQSHIKDVQVHKREPSRVTQTCTQSSDVMNSELSGHKVHNRGVYGPHLSANAVAVH